MKREDIEPFLNKKIHITADFGNNNPMFYTGVIKNLNDEIVVILDKFKKHVTIDLNNIKKIEEE